eukprot:Selendium_serpulae@DN6369_c0_g1_i6.p1
MVKTPRSQRLENRQTNNKRSNKKEKVMSKQHEVATTANMIDIVADNVVKSQVHHEVDNVNTAQAYQQHMPMHVDSQTLHAQPGRPYMHIPRSDLPKLELVKLTDHPSVDDAEKWLDDVEQWTTRYRAWGVHTMAHEERGREVREEQHKEPPRKINIRCRFFGTPKGCLRGEQCRFRHDQQNQQVLATTTTTGHKRKLCETTKDKPYAIDTGASNHVSHGELAGDTVTIRTAGGNVNACKKYIQTPVGRKTGWVIPNSPSLLSCGKLCSFIIQVERK